MNYFLCRICRVILESVMDYAFHVTGEKIIKNITLNLLCKKQYFKSFIFWLF